MWWLCSITCSDAPASCKLLIRSLPGSPFLAQYFMNCAVETETKSVKRSSDGVRSCLYTYLPSAPGLTGAHNQTFLVLTRRPYFLSLTKGVFWPIHSITIVNQWLHGVFNVRNVRWYSQWNTRRLKAGRWEQSRKSGLDNLLHCLVLGYNCRGINNQFSKARVVFWPCQ